MKFEKCCQCGVDYVADGSEFKYCSQDCADYAYDDYIEGMTEAYEDDLYAINEEYRKEKDYL